MGISVTFSDALTALKKGEKIARRGWNRNSGPTHREGMWLTLVWPSEMVVGGQHQVLPSWIAIRTAGGLEHRSVFVPWTASQTDMLSDDWEIV